MSTLWGHALNQTLHGHEGILYLLQQAPEMDKCCLRNAGLQLNSILEAFSTLQYDPAHLTYKVSLKTCPELLNIWL